MDKILFNKEVNLSWVHFQIVDVKLSIGRKNIFNQPDVSNSGTAGDIAHFGQRKSLVE